MSSFIRETFRFVAKVLRSRIGLALNCSVTVIARRLPRSERTPIPPLLKRHAITCFHHHTQSTLRLCLAVILAGLRSARVSDFAAMAAPGICRQPVRANAVGSVVHARPTITVPNLHRGPRVPRMEPARPLPRPRVIGNACAAILL